MPTVSRPLNSEVPGIATHPGDDICRPDLTPDPRIVLLPEGNSNDICPCAVVSFGRGETHLRTNRRIEPATRALLRIDGVSIPGVITCCIQETDGYLTCIATGPADGRGRRSSDRLPADAPCALIAPGEPGAGWAVGRITDYSWFGLGLKSALQLKAGTTICVKTDTMLIAGLVRHYRRCEDGSVHTGLDVTDILEAADSGRSERLIHRIRRQLAEFIAGRPLERLTGFGHAIPWAFSGTVSAKNKQYQSVTLPRP
jgi:hypothetical protein